MHWEGKLRKSCMFRCAGLMSLKNRECLCERMRGRRNEAATNADVRDVQAGSAEASRLVKGVWRDACCDGSYLATGLGIEATLSRCL
jgi:hypothetical protein